MSERYECVRSAVRRTLHLIHYEGEEGFYAVPPEARRQGPWTDIRRGEVMRLKAVYRAALARDGYVLVEDSDFSFAPEV